MARKILLPTGPVSPGAIGSLTGGQLGKAYPVRSVMMNQDRVLWHGRRVVARVGANGAGEWQVPSTDASMTAGQTHPDPGVDREAGAWKFLLTPGYQLQVAVIAQPSGGQQKAVGGGNWGTADVAAGGYVTVTAAYYNGVTTWTVVREITPPVSTEEFYGETTDDAWSTIWGPHIVNLHDDGAISVLSEAEGISEHDVEVTLTVEYVGGVRVIEVVVFEHPVAYVRDWTDSEYVAHCFTGGTGLPLPQYPSQYPIQRLQESTPDPTCGSLQAVDVAAAQQRRLGPLLVASCAWDEVDVDVDDTAAVGWSTSSTTLEDLPTDGAVTSYAEANPGWSAASGANARRFDLSGDLLELRDDDGVLPVRVRVYALNSGGAGNPATLRVQTSASSFVEGQITNSTIGWTEFTGELRCGIGAQDFASVQLLGRVSNVAYALRVRTVVVEYDGERVL